MPDHTPGPWTECGLQGWSRGGSSEMHPCFNGHVVSANGQKIIMSSCLLGVMGATPCEAFANARLIAAAPELLAACEVLLTCSLPFDVSGRAMVDKARAAIAKAKGIV